MTSQVNKSSALLSKLSNYDLSVSQPIIKTTTSLLTPFSFNRMISFISSSEGGHSPFDVAINDIFNCNEDFY